eukprot:scaffold7066_cov253-Pinguiococcus_pyrenoidosus.AAC.2
MRAVPRDRQPAEYRRPCCTPLDRLACGGLRVRQSPEARELVRRGVAFSPDILLGPWQSAATIFPAAYMA